MTGLGNSMKLSDSLKLHRAYRIVFLLLVVSPILFVGCEKGPKVKYCVIDDGGLACPEGLVRFPLIQDHYCASPQHTGEILAACMDRRPMPEITMCILEKAASNPFVACSDGNAEGYLSFINYSCLSSLDFQSFMVACKKRRSGL